MTDAGGDLRPVNAPAAASEALPPPCFAAPDRVPACRSCQLRADCYEEQYKKHAVYLLPKNRPVRRREKRRRFTFAEE